MFTKVAKWQEKEEKRDKETIKAGTKLENNVTGVWCHLCVHSIPLVSHSINKQ
jgi:hypothetical protein